MAATSLATLLTRVSKTAIYEKALGIATALGLGVTSWQAGDPTRSLYHLEAWFLDVWEDVAVSFIESGFLEYANGEWLKFLAKQVFNVDVPEATNAVTDVVLTNNGGGLYTDEDTAPGNLVFKNSANGKTYTNITGGTLASGPGTTLTVTVRADEAGSESSAAAGEIDSMVTSLLGVTCTNPTAAIGTDEQDRNTTIQQCRDKLGSLSPNGPRDAYTYVARESSLTGTNAVTRARSFGDSDTGEVTLYIAGPSGAVAEPDRALVEAATVKWATPLCITPTVLSASQLVVDITYELWVYTSVNKTEAEVESDVESELDTMASSLSIGGDIVPPATTGYLFKSLVESTILGTYPGEAFRVDVTLPASDTALTNAQVVAIGTVTGTVHLVARNA